MKFKLTENRHREVTNLDNVSFGRRKTIKGIAIGTILGGIIFGGIGVAAVTLAADQIKYTPSNENFNATNAQEALDEIYKMAEQGGSYTKSQTLTGSITVPGASSRRSFSITFNELSKIDGYLNDLTFDGSNRAVINSMSVEGNVLTFTCTNGNSTSAYSLQYNITAFEF